MPAVLAICAHPDDIEFYFAGAMLQLSKRGWDLHYMNLCDGSRGSTTMDQATCAATRLREAKNACRVLGAQHYDPIFPDMEAVYTTENLKKVAAVIRQCRATIVLTHSPQDYMEDHEVACKLATMAAFCHGMPNLESIPPQPVYMDPVTVYHAQPVGGTNGVGEIVRPHFFVDEADVLEAKIQALACHESQKQWLDESQGLDSYLATAREISTQMGKMSGKFEFAEGWRRHQHWGLCGPDDDPMVHALADVIHDTRPHRGSIPIV
ncbi:MAG: PIG-L family deacetylase [Planctomycetota bacterium]